MYTGAFWVTICSMEGFDNLLEKEKPIWEKPSKLVSVLFILVIFLFIGVTRTAIQQGKLEHNQAVIIENQKETLQNQAEGKIRTYSTQAKVCIVLTGIGQDIPTGDSCWTKEVLQFWDPAAVKTTASQKRQTLNTQRICEVLIAMNAFKGTLEECVSVS